MSMLRNNPATDHMVKPVNHDTKLRGLRVMTYIPNHTAAIKKAKLIWSVVVTSIELPGVFGAYSSRNTKYITNGIPLRR